MKRIFLIIGVISSLCACRQENRYLSEGEGALNLQVTVGEAVERWCPEHLLEMKK